MPEQKPPESQNYLSVADMQSWVRQERADSTKALELRLKDATDIVAAYASGKLTPEEADERHWRFQQRWPEALPGTHAAEHLSDAQILASIDEAQGPYSTPKQTREKYRGIVGDRHRRDDIRR